MTNPSTLDDRLPVIVKDIKLNLPFFSYGVFKPDESAFHLIKNYINGKPQKATISGTLFTRDGLPMIKLNDDTNSGNVNGYLIYFLPNDAPKAYEEICKFGSDDLYKIEQTELITPEKTSCYVIVGKKPSKGAKEYEYSNWSCYSDPLFKYSLCEIQDIINLYNINDKFFNKPEESISHDEWSRFLKFQMAYLLLWSCIERFTVLNYGLRSGPNNRINLLGSDNLFIEYLNNVVIDNSIDRIIFDTRNNNKILLDKNNSNNAIKYYYQVRCNLTHRGKGVSNDFEIIRVSLKELFEIFKNIYNFKYSEHLKFNAK